MPTVSLIIPAYNEEKYLGACLRAAIAAGRGRWHEIIVVDNASSDRTAAIAQSFPGVTLIRESRKGTNWARQAGAAAATGDLLAFVDADTRMSADWPNQVLRAFSADHQLVCLSGPYSYYDLSWWQRPLVKIYLVGCWLAAHLVGYLAIFGNLVLRRETWQKMGGLDTQIVFYGDDTDTARRAHQFGKVKFSFNLIMPTSARRLQKQGLVKNGWLYALNFFSEVWQHRPATRQYIDVR